MKLVEVEENMSPLALKLSTMVRFKGPITVSEYMQRCLSDAEHGYYQTQCVIELISCLIL